MSVDDLYDWLMYSDTCYTLDFTLSNYDDSNPYVQRYFAQGTKVQYVDQGTQYELDDVIEKDGALSLGNFYRFAKALNLNIEVTSDTRITWNIHGRLQIIGTGSTAPYIQVSLIKQLLNSQS